MKVLAAFSWEEPHGWNDGGIIVSEEIAQSIRVTHLAKVIIFYEEERKSNDRESKPKSPGQTG